MDAGDVWQLVIGALALVVAGATLWYVLEDRRERRRAHSWPTLNVPSYGTFVDPEQAGATHSIWLDNSGGVAATIHAIDTVGFTWAKQGSRSVPSVVPAHSQNELRIECDDIDAAWLRISYAGANDLMRSMVVWMPISSGSPHYEDWVEQRRALAESTATRRSRRRRHKAYMGKTVGPGGVAQREHRSKWSDDRAKLEAFHDETMGVATSKPD